MSYSNEFLRNFRPVFLAILKAQSFRPERVELVVIDEERSHVFEPADVRDVLEQIGDDLNYLTDWNIYSWYCPNCKSEVAGLKIFFRVCRENV